MFYRLPPTGNPIVCEPFPDYEQFLNDLFYPYKPFYFNSGAASLAAALLALTRQKEMWGREVLLPAYACPEIVSAILYAGCVPVLVDLEPDSPRMDLRALADKLTERVLAVVAVRLFGIPERVGEIHSLIKPYGVVLIEDNAQYFPGEGERFSGESDIVIISFGRGKPVSLLGGGAAMARDETLLAEIAEVAAEAEKISIGRLDFNRNAWLYNRLISPRLYWIPAALPFLKLGETRFKPMNGVYTLGEGILRYLPANVLRYWQQEAGVQSSISAILRATGQGYVVDMVRNICGDNLPRLLRYPILVCSRAVRDSLYERLHRRGLGVTKMYPLALPKITGLEGCFAEQFVPNAESFAERILTLPTHDGVQHKDLDGILDALASCAD